MNPDMQYPDWFSKEKENGKQSWRCSTDRCNGMTSPGIGPRISGLDADGNNVWSFECKKCYEKRKKKNRPCPVLDKTAKNQCSCVPMPWPSQGEISIRLIDCPFCVDYHQVFQCLDCVDNKGHDSCGFTTADNYYMDA